MTDFQVVYNRQQVKDESADEDDEDLLEERCTKEYKYIRRIERFYSPLELD